MFNEVIRVGTTGLEPYKKGRDTDRRKTMCRHSKKASVYRSGRKASSETNTADTLILDFQLPGLWEYQFLSLIFCYLLPSPWYSVMAALTD